MRQDRTSTFRCGFGCALALMVASVAPVVSAQKPAAPAGTYERVYRQSKIAVDRALKQLEPSMAGRLPVLEGFAEAGEHPLSRYQRAYYQTAVQVTPGPSGGSLVRVSTKVTAWYADASGSRSGYQLLTSNGRLESDLLDQLSELLSATPRSAGVIENKTQESRKNSSESFPTNSPSAWSSKPPSTAPERSSQTAISAPTPATGTAQRFPSTTMAPGSLTPQQLAETKNMPSKADDAQSKLESEAAGLEEALKNQAHPKNLVAIKKTGTPVVESPSLNGKVLFLASAEDEFEMLDYNEDWVHVRISGLSRGWIWRTSLEMPEGISDIPLNGAAAAPVVADLFEVTREETAPFPGDWEALRGKNVKIISVQKVHENEKDSGAQAKLEFAKSLLDKNYADLAARAKELSGIVLIFDSVDGGMIAATLPTVRQWKAGTLSDAALWHQCYFDPPETFTVSSSSGGHS